MSAFLTQLPSTSRTERRRRYNLSRTLGAHTLDRVNVLGNDEDYGHTGQVNHGTLSVNLK